MTISRSWHAAVRGAAATAFCVALMAAYSARADLSNAKKRALLAAVHRVAVAPAFYGTGRLAKTEAKGEAEKPNPKLAEYLDRLRKLQDRTRTLLPERLAARTS